MHSGFKELVIVLAVVLLLFGGPLFRFVRAMKKRSEPPKPSPPRPQRGRKVRASEDIVDAEIINQK